MNHPQADQPIEFTGTLKEALEMGMAIIDIRDQVTATQQPLPVACQNMQADQIVAQQENLADKPLLLVCYGGFSSLTLSQQLRQLGFTQVYSKKGGAASCQG